MRLDKNQIDASPAALCRCATLSFSAILCVKDEYIYVLHGTHTLHKDDSGYIGLEDREGNTSTDGIWMESKYGEDRLIEHTQS